MLLPAEARREEDLWSDRAARGESGTFLMRCARLTDRAMQVAKERIPG
jgi:hypothetical protein